MTKHIKKRKTEDQFFTLSADFSFAADSSLHHCRAIFSRKEAEKETTIDMVWLASFAPKIATIASRNGML